MNKNLAVGATFTSLAAVFVAARLWTRFKVVKGSGFDDLFIIVSFVRVMIICLGDYGLEVQLLTSDTALLCRPFCMHSSWYAICLSTSRLVQC